ncbi:MAG: hypothetical protein J0I06_25240 [Planctomycetes bacterium]|nr:hypothetical protein [Planctomycetota bacterium]
MTQKNHRPPVRTPAVPLPVAFDRASAGADGVNIIAMTPAPRRWLHVTLGLPVGADPARAALAAAWFATRLRAIDKRLRLTVDRQRCAATAGELVLAFSPLRGGALAAEWLEEAKPAVRDLAVAEFEGAEVKAVEVISE